MNTTSWAVSCRVCSAGKVGCCAACLETDRTSWIARLRRASAGSVWRPRQLIVDGFRTALAAQVEYCIRT